MYYSMYAGKTVLGHTYKCKLAVEMFKAKNMLSRLSSHGQITESRRRGKLMVIPRKKLDGGRDSALFRGPVVWNCLDKAARDCENIGTFKRALRISDSKIALQKVSFVKGTCTNNHKDLQTFIYY